MNNNVYILKNRAILYISGEGSKDFLQNLISNDINKVTNNSSCFASLLTPQGKYLFDFIIVKHKSGYFLDCEKTQAGNLINRLNIYKLNSNVEILNLSNEFEVAVISKDKYLSLDGTQDLEGNTTKYNNDVIFLDPRSTKLGGRIIANLEKLMLSIKSLGLKSQDPKKYYDLSHKNGIAQINTKNLQDKVFGLECNFEELNAIDFKKGCYVGQENTARMKLKNKLRKKLVPLETDKKFKTGSDVKFKDNKIGTVLISEPYPFALIKLVEPNYSEFKDKDLSIDNNKSKIIL